MCLMLIKGELVYKYGEFFPAEISPFCYNETQAQDYFPTTKKKALKMGYRWRDRKVNEYVTTIEAENLRIVWKMSRILIIKKLLVACIKENAKIVAGSF